MGGLPVEPSRNFSALLVEEKIARTKVVMRERDAVNRGHISFQPMGEFRDEGDILVAILFPDPCPLVEIPLDGLGSRAGTVDCWQIDFGPVPPVHSPPVSNKRHAQHLNE